MWREINPERSTCFEVEVSVYLDGEPQPAHVLLSRLRRVFSVTVRQREPPVSNSSQSETSIEARADLATAQQRLSEARGAEWQ